jgi:hypothetical protein
MADPRYAEVLARAEEEIAPPEVDEQEDDEDDASYRRRIAASVMTSRGAGPGPDLGAMGSFGS